MTIAKLPELSVEEVVDRLAIDQAAALFPLGCRCGESKCDYCRALPVARKRILSLIRRMRETQDSRGTK